MHPFRRKASLFNSEAVAAMKGRKNNNLPIFVVVFSVCLFGVFIYNEDVKSIAEFPFSRPKSSQETVQEVVESTKHVEMEDTVKEVVEDTKKGKVRVTVSKNSRAKLEKSQDDQDDSDETRERVDLKTVVAAAEEEKEVKIELPEAKEERKEEEEEEEEEEVEVVELPPEDCDLYTGQWVLDDMTHPLYKEDECEFLTSQVTCMKNGRKDSMYQKWKWQPRDCSLPK